MFTDVIGTPLAAQDLGFGPSEWIAVGLTVAFFLVAVFVPAVVANRVSWSRARRAEPELLKLPAHTAADERM